MLFVENNSYQLTMSESDRENKCKPKEIIPKLKEKDIPYFS